MTRRGAVKPARRRLEPGPSPSPDFLPPRWRQYLWIAAEIGLLLLAALVATLTVMGRASSYFGGTSLTESLLPFAGTVLFLAISGSAVFWLWMRLRRVLVRRGPGRPALAALILAIGALGFAMRPAFRLDLASLRSLVGGAEQAGKDSIAHQVFAAYRRTNLDQMQILLERSRPFLPAIRSAARACGVDEEVMVGIG
ncbi:MAG: transglycosylase, partial [Methylococcus sp.]